jgi:hypothetical protein
MGEAVVRKTGQPKTVTVASSGTTSDDFCVEAASFGGVYMPAALTSTSISFTVCDTKGGTYVALEDAAGAAIALTVEASRAYALPPELFGFRYAKLVCGSSEGAEREFVISLKG